MDVHLGSAQAIYYMGQTTGFEDVRLVSSQGQYHSINSCIFASMSTACFDIVNHVYSDPFAGEEFFITTEFSSELLQTFIEFANSGTIRKQSTFDLENDLQLNQVFAAFGINLNQLSFTTEKDPVLDEAKPIVDDFICPEISELIKEEDEWWIKTEPEDDGEDQPLSLKRKRKSGKTKKRKTKYIKKPSKLEREGEGEGSYYYYWFPQDESLRDKWKDLPYAYQCNQCVRRFFSKFEHMQHLRRHQSDNVEKVWFCIICDDGFKSIASMRSHFKQQHSDGKDMICPKCDWKVHLFSFGRMLSHLELHSNIEKCVECGEVVKDIGKNQINAHKKRNGKYHDGKCRLCPELEAFKSRESYLSHLNEKHEGKLQYKCGVCPEFFDTRELMKIHKIRECKVKTKPLDGALVCNFCGKQFKNKSMLRYHEQDKHGDDKLPCNDCGRVLKHPMSLKRHKRTHKRYTCDICGMSGLLNKFKKHMQINHTEEHLKAYICPVCDPVRGFASIRYFEEHMNVHNGVKPFNCSYCQASFASRGTLAGHIRGAHKDIKRRSK